MTLDLDARHVGTESPGDQDARWEFPSPTGEFVAEAEGTHAAGVGRVRVRLNIRRRDSGEAFTAAEHAAIDSTPPVWVGPSSLLFWADDANHVIDAATRRSTTIGRAEAHFSQLSPGGDLVVGSDSHSLLLLSVADLSVREVFRSPTTLFPNMAWSPDGQSLVYSRGRWYREVADAYVYSMTDGVEYKIVPKLRLQGGYWTKDSGCAVVARFGPS